MNTTDTRSAFHHAALSFQDFGQRTIVEYEQAGGRRYPLYYNEFWTSRQRACHSLHEISYRACYKPQLPEFFIRRLCPPDGRVYDPFMGRGTTVIEARLLGRQAAGNDVNPLSAILCAPRLEPPPDLASIQRRLAEIPLEDPHLPADEDLLVFFHPQTLAELNAWRIYFATRLREGSFDTLDAWLRMVATNRLTGHSKGFFSVYTLPPNQATSPQAQRKINAKRGQSPDYRPTRERILKKSRQLLADPLPSSFSPGPASLFTGSAAHTPGLPDASVDLVVTSPPFLDTVDYITDNWMRMWFCEVSLERDSLWQLRSVADWSRRMTEVFRELRRILKPGGHIAFEVGEVRKGSMRLDEEVVRAAIQAGLAVECVLIQCQEFTKTANCWGVQNNSLGTNTNRIVLLRHP